MSMLSSLWDGLGVYGVNIVGDDEAAINESSGLLSKARSGDEAKQEVVGVVQSKSSIYGEDNYYKYC
jgi:hypothetical protein